MINLAVLGHGTVGSGVAEVFFSHKQALEQKAGCPLDLKYILDVRAFPELPYADRFVTDFQTIVQDDSVKIVAEVIGGVEPAYTFTKECLSRGKSVVTSNKELVATHGAELLEIARQNDCNYFFEASVGGGIPIIRPLHMCLAANRIDEIAGILNGTTNFILTKMIRENMPFEQALALAQQLGYAERNPSADVDGHDACRKICILASLSFGSQVHPGDVPTEGIREITLEDVGYAADWGGVIKLIGMARQNPGGRMTALVAPAFIRRESQLGSVDDVFNAILVRGDATGDVVFYGKGAGKLPTASAVVGDMIDCAKATGTNPSLRWAASEGGNVAPLDENRTALYLRLSGLPADQLAQAAGEAFGSIRLLHRSGCPADELAFMTPVDCESAHAQRILQLERMGASVLGKIRVLEY